MPPAGWFYICTSRPITSTYVERTGFPAYIHDPEEEQQHVEDEEDEELNQCIDDDEDKHNSTLLSWPLSLPQIAPEQQNTTALCLQFALDSACHQYDKKM